jgi:hypothetical protein
MNFYFNQNRQYTIHEAYQILVHYIFAHKNVKVSIKIETENDIKLFEKALINALYWWEEER